MWRKVSIALKKGEKQTNKAPNSHYLHSKYELTYWNSATKGRFLGASESYLSVGPSWLCLGLHVDWINQLTPSVHTPELLT